MPARSQVIHDTLSKAFRCFKMAATRLPRMRGTSESGRRASSSDGLHFPNLFKGPDESEHHVAIVESEQAHGRPLNGRGNTCKAGKRAWIQ